MQVRVFYHDKCFDGACSASLFTRFHRECVTKDAAYEYHGLVHRAGALFDENEFTGDENAIVDFKYSASPKHHLVVRSSSLGISHAAGSRAFPRLPARPCLLLRASSSIPPTPPAPASSRTSRQRGSALTPKPVADLIHWANIVDGALIESPEAAVEMAAPAMKLTLIIESTQDPAFIPRLIPLLTEMPLAEVLAQPFVASLLPPLARAPSKGNRA